MADKKPIKKAPQISLEEYNKIKEKKAKDKLKLSFPWPVRFFIILPIGYFIFLVTYYLLHIRFTAEH